MFDNVNFWLNKCDISNSKTVEMLHYLTDVTEWKNEKGYNCTGKLKNYSVCISEGGMSMKGSLAKNHFGDNIHTLTRKDTQLAIEELSDQLHIDINVAKVTRLDISTVLHTKRPPACYFQYLGEKPYFKRLQVHEDTLQYNNHQRQIIFYDKTKEAAAKDVQIPEILQNRNLLRYELRYTKRLNRQLNADLTAAKLYDVDFYRAVIQSWYNEFKTIQKLKNQSFMIDNINTTKEAETALFATLLQEKGQHVIDEYLAELKAKNVFKERQRYSELKRKLNTILQVPKGEKSDLMQELETAMFGIARYAR